MRMQDVVFNGASANNKHQGHWNAHLLSDHFSLPPKAFTSMCEKAEKSFTMKAMACPSVLLPAGAHLCRREPPFPRRVRSSSGVARPYLPPRIPPRLLSS